MSRHRFVVAGMHRSRTSFTASVLAAMGISMGPRMMAADGANPRGYFEDLDFHSLCVRILRAAVSAEEIAHPGWGWTDSERLDLSATAAFSEEADALVASRERCHPYASWGWKDPRSTLLLDFWNGRVSDACFVLPFRSPAEVADSLHRLRTPFFESDADLAYRIWRFYNRALLGFFRRHPERCLIFDSGDVIARPQALRSWIERRFGWSGPENGELATLRDDTLWQAARPGSWPARTPELAESCELLHGELVAAAAATQHGTTERTTGATG